MQIGWPSGHTGIFDADFHENGKWFVTAGSDNTIRVWETTTGRLLKVYQGHTDGVYNVQYSADMNRLLSSSFDSTAIIWNLNSGLPIQLLEGSDCSITYSSFNADGSLVLTSCDYNSTILWDATNGKILWNIPNASRGIFSPDTKLIAAISDKYEVNIWDVATQQAHKPFGSKVSHICFSPNGKYLATGSMDHTVEIWDLAKGKRIFHLKGHLDEINGLAFSPDNKKLITLSYDATGRIWNATDGKLIAVLEGHTGPLRNAFFSNDSKYVVTIAEDLEGRLYNAETGELINVLQGHQEWLTDVAFHPNGKYFLTTSYDGSAKLWNLPTGKLMYTISDKLKNNTARLNIIDDKTLEAFSDGEIDYISSFDIASARWIGTRFTDKDYFHYVNPDSTVFLNFKFWSPDSTLFFRLANNDLELELSENEIGLEVYLKDSVNRSWLISGHTNTIMNIDFSKDKKYFLTSSMDGTAKLWDAKTCQLIYSVQGSEGSLSDAFFHPDGNIFATEADNGTILFWETATGKKITEIPSQGNWLMNAQFSPDGRTLLTAMYRLTATVWDVKSGKPLFTLGGEKDKMESIAYNPTGTQIVYTTTDGRTRVIDSFTGKETFSLTSDNYWIRDAYYSSNGKYLFTSSTNAGFKIWNATTGQPLFSIMLLPDSSCAWISNDGYYMVPREFAKSMYFIEGMQTYGFDQLDLSYNRPDLVLANLGRIFGNKEPDLIDSYHRAWVKRIQKLGIDTNAFKANMNIPLSNIIDANQIPYEQSNESLTIHIQASDTVFELERFNIWMNEVPLYGVKGISLRDRHLHLIDTTITLQLSQGINKIETSVLNSNATESYRQPLYINYTPSNSYQPKTYFIGIGIDQFKDSKHNLKYSVKDIRDLSKTLSTKISGPLIVDTIFNQNVNATNVQQLKKKLMNTSINDKVIISYSGHGLLSDAHDYYLSGYEVDFSNPEVGGIEYGIIENLLDGIPARKKLLLIDACHSGEVDKDERMEIQKLTIKGNTKGVMNEKGADVGEEGNHETVGLQNSFKLMQELFVNVQKGSGAIIISAAGGDQFALENGDLKNGVFTYAIMDYINNHDTVSMNELKAFVYAEVLRITNGLQKPTSRLENLEINWDLLE